MPNKRGFKINRGSEIFVKFNKQWEGGAVGISKNPLISVMNKKRDMCNIMLDLKISKQTRSEASKNKVIIKRASNISIN